MSEFFGILTTIGQVKMAASIGGAALDLSVIRVGDGAGAPILPHPGMTDLVRRVGNPYPIQTSAADADNPTYWRVSAIIPASDGPFDMREIGVFDAVGDLIAIARHPLVEKRGAGQGVAIEIDTDIVFPVMASAQLTVNVQTEGYATVIHVAEQLENYLPLAEVPETLHTDRVAIHRPLRPPFIAVNSATQIAPPVAPTLGDTYVVPAGASGGWAAKVHHLAQWTGAGEGGHGWIYIDPPMTSLVRAMDTGLMWQRSGGGWTLWVATIDEHTGVAPPSNKPATPAGVAAMIAAAGGSAASFLPFLAVASVTATAPPGAPTVGAVYIVAPAATGAWDGQAGQLAQWTGTVWVFVTMPLMTIVAAADTGILWQRRVGGWVQWVASTGEHTGGAPPADKPATPAGVAAMIAADRPTIARPLAVPYMAVLSVSVSVPPGAPALGATYIVGGAPTGTWAGKAGQMAQWTGTAWVFADPPLTTIVSAIDTSLLWQRRAGGWMQWIATTAEHIAAVPPSDKPATPAGVAAMITAAVTAGKILFLGQ